jgi:hypothetical protein
LRVKCCGAATPHSRRESRFAAQSASAPARRSGPSYLGGEAMRPTAWNPLLQRSDREAAAASAPPLNDSTLWPAACSSCTGTMN